MKKLHIQLGGIRGVRNARRVEDQLQLLSGVTYASVSAVGIVHITWDQDKTNKSEIIQSIKEMDLDIEHTDKLDNESPVVHNHEHVSNPFISSENVELYFAIGSGLFWISGLATSYLNHGPEHLSIGLLVISCLLGGFFTFKTAARDLLRGKFEIDFLMLFAAIGAAILGKWGEAALLLFLFSLGHALEHYAMSRARKSIAALSKLAPPVALVKRNGTLTEVPIEQLEIGDMIVVKPNSKISADGIVIRGSSPVDQSSITGESIPVDKRPCPNWKEENVNNIHAEHRVFAGTINGSGVLEIEVTKDAKDSTLSRLIMLVKEAETQKSPTQHLTDKFEKYYVPFVLTMVVLLIFAFLIVDESFDQSFYRAMSVLIAASPCALAISTPSAVLAGVARAARQGVLIKGGRPLEDLGGLQAIAFDKTGTLTEGRPTLTNAIPFGVTSKSDLLRIAVSIEALSDHPIAAAIVDGGKQELGDMAIPEATDLKALIARGVQASIEETMVYIGNRRLFEELTGQDVPQEIDLEMSKLESSGHTAMIVGQGEDYLGIISVMDIARNEAKATLQSLKNMGIKRMVMLTGDNQKVADAIAKDIGITDPMGSLLPEDKVNAITQLKEKVGNVAMVGDGVNDAPAMAKSTVGIAMGAAGSDVALETADIALMADKLDNLPFTIGLSRKANQIIRQNLFISLGMVVVLVPMTILGTIAIGPAVVGHEGSTLLVVLNALRLLRYNV